MKKIIEYKLADAFVPERLEEDVKQLMEFGFQPFGELKVVTNGDGNLEFFQAMVKYES